MGLLIETLVNFTRIDMVDEKQQEYYLGRFREAKRVINKVGSKEEQKAIHEIKRINKKRVFTLIFNYINKFKVYAVK